MRAFWLALAVLGLFGAFASRGTASAESPIKLHPDNPHYLLFRGKPTILVTSTEHYGAVLNMDFDYVPYLNELHAKGLNLTRTFSGAYCEATGSFQITDNTLAPARERLICPWARSSTPGYAGGGNKFDLAAWDKAYFDRLKDFVAQAGKRGIVVEFVLFCPFYEDVMWNLSPMNAKNNVNGIGQAQRNDVYALKHADLTALQERMVRKVVEELRDFDNVYFEICNEPYFGGVTLAWQRQIAATITKAEASFPGKHLIAQNIANGSQKITDADPAVSIFNFHYATPPVTVGLNYGLNRALADDETGFRGSSDAVYRTEAWEFLIAGGAIYDNLDYSFTPKQEDGSAKPNAPGGGGATLRTQLKILKEFIQGFDFVKMSPNDSVIKGGVPDKATARALVENGKAYAVYVRGGSQANLVLDLPAGVYKSEWLNTKTGRVEKAEAFDHAGGNRTFASPAYSEDIALGIKRR
ncbi:MAG: hypothetical protein ACYC35_17120 [Pirellulales bacterium]